MSLDEKGQVTIFILASNIFAILTQKLSARRSDGKVRVGVVEALAIYPIKSCSGITIDKVKCTDVGFESCHIMDR